MHLYYISVKDCTPCHLLKKLVKKLCSSLNLNIRNTNLKNNYNKLLLDNNYRENLKDNNKLLIDKINILENKISNLENNYN